MFKKKLYDDWIRYCVNGSKKQIDQVVLISGDSDFVPAAKLARREGLDFVLDPLGSPIKDELHEHIDGLITCDEKYIESFKINYK